MITHADILRAAATGKLRRAIGAPTYLIGETPLTPIEREMVREHLLALNIYAAELDLSQPTLRYVRAYQAGRERLAALEGSEHR